MSPPNALDDSALGRFQNSKVMSASDIDPNTLSYCIRSESSSSRPSSASESAPDAPGPTPQHEIGETPQTAGPEHDLEDDMASTVSGMSDFASVNNETGKVPEIEQLKISPTGPELEYRYIKSSDTYGRAPFTKPHFVSNSTEFPFSGPHTAIDIPFGADYAKYIHIPQTLRATELGLAELAMFWLWSGLRRDEGTGKETAHYGPVISPDILAHHKTGPPAAPYPMTESTFPAFVGPRTCVLDNGAILKGWILQIPRYLSEEETKVASEKLQEITDKITPWSLQVDPSCRLGVKRTEEEQADLKAFLEQQNKDMILLKDVIGLDFASQDDKEGTSAPIWRRESPVDMALKTPKKPTMLPTPPTTGEKQPRPKTADVGLHIMHAATPTDQGAVMTKVTSTQADLNRAARNPFRTAAHIRAWSRDVAEFSAEPDPGEQSAPLRLLNSENDGIKANGNDLAHPKIIFPASADLGPQPVTVVPGTSRLRRAISSSVQGEHTAQSDNRRKSIMAATMGGLYDLVSTVPICDIIIVIFCSFLLCWLLLSELSWLQNHIIWPSDITAWLAEIPERRNAIMLFTFLLGPFVGLLLSAIPNLLRVLTWVLAGVLGLFVAAQVLSML